MNLSYHVDEHRYPLRMRWFLAAAWLLILAKCATVCWAIDRWHVPIRPAWVVVPTLMIAVLATWIWVFARKED